MTPEHFIYFFKENKNNYFNLKYSSVIMVDIDTKSETEKIEKQLYNIKLGDDNYDSALLEAEKFKNQGNNYVKDNKFVQAVDSFSKAIDIKVETLNNSIYLSNRAFIHIKMENFGLALSDANKAIEIDNTYVKAYYRRASALLFLRKYDEALKDLLHLQSILPDNEDIQLKINNTKAERRRERFFQSIQSDQKGSTKTDLFKKQFAEYKVDSSYNHLVYESENKIVVNGEKRENNKEEEDLTSDKYNKNSNGFSTTTIASPAFDSKIDENWVISLMEGMKQNKYIHKKYLTQMVYDAKTIFDREKTLVDITVEDTIEISVCGDTHGQYYDLLNIFKINGYPSKTNPYLFNGDFVDRGSFSVEVIVTLIAWKLLYPNHLFMSRGNHESKNLNKLYGFEGEVKSKYDEQLYELFSSMFCSIPLCHVINKKVFVVHGGLFSKDNVSLDDLRNIDRKGEPSESGLMCECLWSDPCKEYGRLPSKRGVGLSFGPDITRKFLEYNNLQMIVRSHEVKQEGYEVEHDGKLVTVFSAPNYCDQMGNKGALVRFKGGDMVPKYITYAHVEHPKIPPMRFANPWMMF